MHYVFCKAFFAPLHRNIHSFLGQEKSAIIDYSQLPFLGTWQKISNKYVPFKKNNTYESLYVLLRKRKKSPKNLVEKTLTTYWYNLFPSWTIFNPRCSAWRKSQITQFRAKIKTKNYAWFSDWQIGAQFADWQKDIKKSKKNESYSLRNYTFNILDNKIYNMVLSTTFDE